jgi:D-amino peptidase
MRVIITSDVEGVTGVDDYRMVQRPNADLYRLTMEYLTEDINAAIRGVLRACRAEILIIDGHAGGKPPNIFDERLEGGAKVIRQGNPYDAYKGADCKLNIGAHAMAGTRDGFMSHTTSGLTSMIVNGQQIGETTKLGWLAECYGVPLVMVAGDAATVREVQHYHPGTETVCVKTAIDRGHSVSIPRAEASRLIEEAAYKGMMRRAEIPFHPVAMPVRLEIELGTELMADRAALIPRMERIAPRRVLYIAADYPEAVKAYNAAVRLARGVQTEQQLEAVTKVPGGAEAREQWSRLERDAWINNEPPYSDPVAAWAAAEGNV